MPLYLFSDRIFYSLHRHQARQSSSIQVEATLKRFLNFPRRQEVGTQFLVMGTPLTTTPSPPLNSSKVVPRTLAGVWVKTSRHRLTSSIVTEALTAFQFPIHRRSFVRIWDPSIDPPPSLGTVVVELVYRMNTSILLVCWQLFQLWSLEFSPERIEIAPFWDNMGIIESERTNH